jgi:cell division ATPase FtsA
MNFFSRKPKDTLNLIIDIQSSVVRGALVVIHTEELTRVVWTLNIDIPYRSHHSSSYLIDTTVKAVEAVSAAAHVFVKDTYSHKDLPKKITKVHCVLSSPWIVSQARTVNQSFDNEVKINRAHIDSIIKAERANMTNNAEGYMIGIEEKIFDVRLNGYSILEWEGASAKFLEISFAVSMASKKIVERFVGACKKTGVHSAHIDFHSSLLLQHISLSMVRHFAEPYILVHVHGELTDIVVANGSTCILFGSHPIGTRTILRHLSSRLKITQTTADSALSIYEDTTIDPLHGAEDTKKIQAILDNWAKNCLKVTSLIPDKYKLTHAIISARNHENAFKNTFSAAYPEIKIELLPMDSLDKSVTFESGTERLRLTVLYLVAIHSLESL